MPLKKQDHDFFELIKREHGELKDLLSQVRSTMYGQQPDAQQARQLIGDLYERIQSHFHHEEKGGYLSEALERAPRLTNLAGRLHEQHETLSEMLGELRNHVQQTVPTDDLRADAWWKELDNQFHVFFNRLLRHETEEDKLVQEAFNRDLGTCD